jgi:hypothetical protein
MHSVRRGGAVSIGRRRAAGHVHVPVSARALLDVCDVQHGRVSTTSPPAVRSDGPTQRMTSGG